MSASLIPLIGEADNRLVINGIEAKDLVQRKIVRARIYELEKSLHEANDTGKTREEMGNLTNHFTKGIYARELFIPKGTVMTSKLHKLPRLCIISQGEVSFTTEFGSQRVKAPYTAVFPPGSKVALFTHEDTVWTAIHGTDETDMEKLEMNLIAKDHGEFETFQNKLKLIQETS